MDTERLRELLEQVRQGARTVEEALEELRHLPYEDLGYARVDHHRSLRTGAPEVIYCPGKTTEQILSIAERIHAKGAPAMATRADAQVAAALLRRFPNARHYETARIVLVPPQGKEAGAVDGAAGPSTSSGTASGQQLGTVLVVSAGTADIPVAEEAAVTASVLGSPVDRLYDVGVAGLHRLLDQRHRLFSANVLVVVAGMEGALASVVGGLVRRPVIAVPTSVGYGANFGGLSALLTMLNTCAAGVAVVNIDNGFGAGYFAHIVNVRGQDNGG